MINCVRAAIVGVALICMPVHAWALTTTFIDGVDGVWSPIAPNNGTVKISPNGSHISWGRSSSGRKSGYVFDGTENSGPHELGESFDLGKFTHNNYAIYGGALKAAALAVTISGRLVDGLTSQAFTITSVFDIIHDETRNKQRKCPYGDKPPCGDLISFATNAGLSETVTFNGVSYLFEATGFLGGFLRGNSLFSDENRKNSAILQGKLTALNSPPPPVSPVPLPAALPLLAVAIGSIGFVSRRRAKV